MNKKLFSAALATAALALSASTYAQQVPTTGTPVTEKKQTAEPFNENSTIRGRVKSVDTKRKLIVIAGADGQDYQFPLTTKAAEIPKVGTETTIVIECSWPPLRCRVDWKSMI
jgi:hypothetical protein